VRNPWEPEKTSAEIIEDLDRTFRSPLIAYFTKRVRDRGEAEDLTQEVFVRLSMHPDRHDGQTIDKYVFTIAVNLLRDRAKSSSGNQERRNRSFEFLSEKAVFLPGLVEGRDPERVLVGKETVQDVLNALGELGERTRDIFVLSRIENMHHREIAVLHGISVSMVEKLMMKAISHLSARFFRP